MKISQSFLKLFIFIFSLCSYGQKNHLSGIIYDQENQILPYVNVYFENTQIGNISNDDGVYEIKNIPNGTYTLVLSSLGYKTKSIKITFSNHVKIQRNFTLKSDNSLDEVVVSGTLRPVTKSSSPVPV